MFTSVFAVSLRSPQMYGFHHLLARIPTVPRLSMHSPRRIFDILCCQHLDNVQNHAGQGPRSKSVATHNHRHPVTRLSHPLPRQSHVRSFFTAKTTSYVRENHGSRSRRCLALYSSIFETNGAVIHALRAFQPQRSKFSTHRSLGAEKGEFFEFGRSARRVQGTSMLSLTFAVPDLRLRLQSTNPCYRSSLQFSGHPTPHTAVPPYFRLGRNRTYPQRCPRQFLSSNLTCTAFYTRFRPGRGPIARRRSFLNTPRSPILQIQSTRSYQVYSACVRSCKTGDRAVRAWC